MQSDIFKNEVGYRPPEDIRVLMGCEKSGVGREAFLKLGFDAYSCDLQPSDDRSNRHFQCDIREILDDGWDVLCLLHPPCKRLCNSGVRWISGDPPKGKTKAQVQHELKEGAALFSDCWNAGIPHTAVENPVMHAKAKALITNFQPHSQVIQPWWFGNPYFKATCWWLKNLPILTPTNKLNPPKPGTEEHKAWSMIHRAPPSAERTNIRSKTFQGHADAFASQWGTYVCHNSIVEVA